MTHAPFLHPCFARRRATSCAGLKSIPSKGSKPVTSTFLSPSGSPSTACLKPPVLAAAVALASEPLASSIATAYELVAWCSLPASKLREIRAHANSGRMQLSEGGSDGSHLCGRRYVVGPRLMAAVARASVWVRVPSGNGAVRLRENVREEDILGG